MFEGACGSIILHKFGTHVCGAHAFGLQGWTVIRLQVENRDSHRNNILGRNFGKVFEHAGRRQEGE